MKRLHTVGESIYVGIGRLGAIVIALAITFMHVYALQATLTPWHEGQSFIAYLQEHNISTAWVYRLPKRTQRALKAIKSGASVYALYDDNGTLESALIPLRDARQIFLLRSDDRTTYDIRIVPIETQTRTFFARIDIETNIYDDIRRLTGHRGLAHRASRIVEEVASVKSLHKGDRIEILYKQRTRFGKCYGMPHVLAMRITRDNKTIPVYVDDKGKGYVRPFKRVAFTAPKPKQVKKTFAMPLRRVRITSRFTHRRWHPILHRYRPHHGVDFGARRGTPILAVNDGKVIYAGWMGGYGKVVKIKHPGGYVSLYAHQSRIRVKRGAYVKRGQIIGYVGNTGRSTGPHLHLGIMKRGRWVDPLRVIGRVSVATRTSSQASPRTLYKKIPLADAPKYLRMLERFAANDTPTYVWDASAFDTTVLQEVAYETRH